MRSRRARSGGREGSHPLGQASQDRPPVTSGLLVQLAIIPDVNDRPEQADLLARRLVGFRGGAHVNLIPLNPTGTFAGQPPDRERINRFAGRLGAAGVTVTVRRNRGVDIDAACGQLRAREAQSRGAGGRGAVLDAGSARMTP